MNVRPISDGLFTDTPSLIGSECTNCGQVYFPTRSACANCGASGLKEKELGNRGTLWSWTMQHFMPKAPFNSGETKDTFTAYGVGLVEMACGVKVKTRLILDDINSIKIGDPYKLVIFPFRENDAETVMSFAFEREDA